MKKITTLVCLFLTISFYGQWIEQVSGVTQNLNDIYCVTENLVFVVGDNGTLLKTSDGGANWIQKSSGTTEILNRIQFANATIGYAVGNNGILLKTIDGGENWTSIATGSVANLYGLSVLSENAFIISGANGLVKKSIDGGISFILLTAPSNLGVLDIQFINNQVGFLKSGEFSDFMSSYNSLYKTIDGGISWTLLINESIATFFFFNENIGFISKNQDSIQKTINGGLDFFTIGDSTIAERDIFSFDGNTTWNIGVNPALCWCEYFCISKKELIDYPSINQTETCTSSNQGYFPLTSIHFATLTTGFISGLNGKIFKNTTGENTIQNPYFNVTDFDENEIVKIFPNPTTDLINITFKEAVSQPVNIEINDSWGKQIFSETFENEQNIATKTNLYSKGIYIMNIVSQQKKLTHKIVIN